MEVVYKNTVTRTLSNGTVKTYTYDKKHTRLTMPITKETRQKIIDEHALGIPKKRIASNNGISIPTINRTLLAHAQL